MENPATNNTTNLTVQERLARAEKLIAIAKQTREDAFKAKTPVWVHVVLFIAWGWLMWRLWLWIDSKSDK